MMKTPTYIWEVSYVQVIRETNSTKKRELIGKALAVIEERMLTSLGPHELVAIERAKLHLMAMLAQAKCVERNRGTKKGLF
jgi:hypothetical protein